MDYLQLKQKSDVQFNGRIETNANWAVPFVSNIKNEFDERYIKIKQQYENLMDEVYWNSIVYGINIKFKPVIGRTYHLYKDDDDYTLSMIGPTEWRKVHVASFKFEHTGKWLKI